MGKKWTDLVDRPKSPQWAVVPVKAEKEEEEEESVIKNLCAHDNYSIIMRCTETF
jgi:hypothetical protein